MVFMTVHAVYVYIFYNKLSSSSMQVEHAVAELFVPAKEVSSSHAFQTEIQLRVAEVVVSSRKIL